MQRTFVYQILPGIAKYTADRTNLHRILNLQSAGPTQLSVSVSKVTSEHCLSYNLVYSRLMI